MFETLIAAVTNLVTLVAVVVWMIAFPIVVVRFALPFIITKNDARGILAIVKEFHNV
jgi:hypothetical protein